MTSGKSEERWEEEIRKLSGASAEALEARESLYGTMRMDLLSKGTGNG